VTNKLGICTTKSPYQNSRNHLLPLPLSRVTFSSNPFQLPGFWRVLRPLQADCCSSIRNCPTNKCAGGCEIAFGSTWDAREGIAFGSTWDALGLGAATDCQGVLPKQKILHHHQCSKCNCHVQGLSLF